MQKSFLKSQLLLAMASWSMGWLVLSGAAASSPDLLPPGYEPRPLGLHALSGGNIIVSPSLTLTNAMLIIEGDTIVRVEEDLTPPTGARVWDMTGTTLYPGFIDPYVLTTTGGEKPQVTRTHADEDATHRATGAWHFFGMTGDEEDPGEKGPGGSYHTVRSDYRVVDHWDFESDERKKWREWGFTAVQLIPSRNLARSWAVHDWQRFPQPLACPTSHDAAPGLADPLRADEFRARSWGPSRCGNPLMPNTQQQTGKLECDPSLRPCCPCFQGKRDFSSSQAVLMASRTHQLRTPSASVHPGGQRSGMETARPGVRN